MTDDHDAADLCAQWRATIAAEKAVGEAGLATKVAIIGTALSLATVLGLIVSVYQTRGALGEARRGNRLNLAIERRARRAARQAAIDQERALEIAASHVEIAREQFQAGFRPYLDIEMFGPVHEDFHAMLEQEDGRRVAIRAGVKVINIGKVPTTITGFDIGFDAAIDGVSSKDVYHLLRPGDHIWLDAFSGVRTHNQTIGLPSPGHVGFIRFDKTRNFEFAQPPKIFGVLRHTDQIGIRRLRGFGFAPISWKAIGPFELWGGGAKNYDNPEN